MKLKGIKTLIFTSLVVFTANQAHATRVLTPEQASKLTFSALTASPAQWKRWTHKPKIVANNKAKYKIRLASYKFHAVKSKHTHHHHYRT